MLQGKGARSPPGKTDALGDMNSKHVSPGQQHSLAAVSQAAAAPVTLTAAHSALAASPRQLQDSSPAGVAFGKQALLQPSAVASHQASAGPALPPARQAGSATAAAQVDGLMTKQMSSASVPSGQLRASAFASPSRQRRDPSPAELALAKQTSVGSPASGIQENAQAFVLSPRTTRDPSPAELGLIRHQSSTSMVLHHTPSALHVTHVCMRNHTKVQYHTMRISLTQQAHASDSPILEAHTCLMGFAMQECMDVQYLQQLAPSSAPHYYTVKSATHQPCLSSTIRQSDLA